MTLKFLAASDGEWDEVLATVRHDFYHLPSYSRLMAPFDGGHAEAVLVREQDHFFFLPYIVRPLSKIGWVGDAGATLFDIVSPYGYPGPIQAGPEAFQRHAVSAWHKVMSERGCVSGFIRMHPLLNIANSAFISNGELIERGRTVSIDLQASDEDLWRQTRENHRRDIVKQRRAGMTASMENDAESLQIFATIYYETMARVGAASYYMFPAEYFRGLQDALGDKISVCIVRNAEGQVLAGGIFTECTGIVQYHLGGTFNSALGSRPSKLMFDYVRTWAKQRGNTVLHLGGGFGAKEDSVFEFKAGFSPRRHAYFTWQLLFQPEAYDGLEHRRRSQSDVGLDAQYFPIYRS
ncbi:MAG TPA: hypothetical protein VGG64_03270 [Pirellulales bacterium]|jgi:hypothetical protein